MGVSTDAILAYGIDLDEDWTDKVPWSYEDGMDYWLYKRYDLNLKYETREEYEAIPEEMKKEIWARQREFLKACPVEDIYHCSLDYPMVVLAIRGTRTTASRGYPKVIEKLRTPGQFAIDRFLRTLEEWGVDTGGEHPRWLLFSMWG